MKPRRVLALLAVLSLTGCGRTLIYERGSGRSGEEFTLTGKRFTRYPVTMDTDMESEMRLLPEESFREARGSWILAPGCWRLETADGRIVSSKTTAIVALFGNDLILWDGPAAGSTNWARLRNIDRIASAEPFALDVRGSKLMAREVTRQNDGFLIETANGRQERVPAGLAKVVRGAENPLGAPSPLADYQLEASMGIDRLTLPRRSPVFALDHAGHAYAFVVGRDEDYLDRWLGGETKFDAFDHQAFKVISLRTIRRWEFDKPWGPTPLVDYALSVAGAAATLGFGCTTCGHKSLYCP